MAKTAFSKTLGAKAKEQKLSLSALAKTIGVGIQSVTAALKGTSTPNAATAAKYAAFLGIEPAALNDLLGKGAATKAAKTGTKKTRKASKQAKSTKAKAPTAKVGRATVDLTKVTIGQVAALLSDDLTMAVYQASAAKRDIIAAILRS